MAAVSIVPDAAIEVPPTTLPAGWLAIAVALASFIIIGLALAGAVLDVFPTEPLPIESPLWGHPKVTITPHNAATSDPRAFAANVLRQIERFERGLPFEHVVDRARGY